MASRVIPRRDLNGGLKINALGKVALLPATASSPSVNVLITGISSGLGEGLAHAALKAGAHVWGISRRPPDKSFSVYGGRLRFLSTDLSDASTGSAALEKWVADVDEWDQVWLNAGLLPPIADLRDTSVGVMRAAFEVNVFANHWLLCGLERVARIHQVVAISSGASVSGHRGWNAYGASKAALNMWVKSFAAEMPAVHFTALAPGLVDTEMQDYLTALAADERYPTVERLKAAKGTEQMPDGLEAGRRLWQIAPQLVERVASGSYVDVRKFSDER